MNNGDENNPATLLAGNFHKSLPHDEFGNVIESDYRDFQQNCDDVENRVAFDFSGVARGHCENYDLKGDKFTNPMAGAADETHGPHPKTLNMAPAPGILSASSAAEMVELYWMALLRDVPLADLDSVSGDAVTEVNKYFRQAINEDFNTEGGLNISEGTIKDLPCQPTANGNNQLDIDAKSLFGCGLKGENVGPRISQFFLQDIGYGVQSIDTRLSPYIAGVDFLTTYDDWLCAQNSGQDKFGRGYGTCNNYDDQVNSGANYFPIGVKRHISTIRDLARFVNRDALHQAYFNAALALDGIAGSITQPGKTILDAGNPYLKRDREGGFGTLSGPDLLTLVSEVASRALKVVWRQKWLVHRRCRPEVYGGMLQMQVDGIPTGPHTGNTCDYGLNTFAADSIAAQKVRASNGTYFLPMAFSAGSPNHPAYGAGHATVAGACATILKAWFDEDAKFSDFLNYDRNQKDPGKGFELLQPGVHISGEEFQPPQPYAGTDLTIGGEVNKLASNVAMGRSMGGVHWRSDNTRSLRLGENIAAYILCKRIREYGEKDASFSFTSFDGNKVTIDGGCDANQFLTDCGL